MTTEVEVKIDSTTGLPEVPEGKFWRVGMIEGVSDYGTPRTYEGVRLMQVKEPRLEKREVPVYGVNWLGIQRIVEHRWEETLVEQEPEEIEGMFFTNVITHDKESIPAIAVNIREEHWHGQPTWKYNVPISDEGITYLADIIWKRHTNSLKAQEEYRIKMDAERALKKKYFGDYPPKTLIG